VKINVDRIQLKTHLETLARIGGTPEGGVTRLSYSSEERAAHRYMAERMEEAGLKVRVDAAGNTLGILAGTKEGLAPILTGSHLDTVINGGRYDGVAGVTGGLEAVRAIKNAGIMTNRPLGVLIFAGEEGGTRFGIGRLGSQMLTGHLKADDLPRLRDKEGISLEEAMRLVGLSPERVKEAVYGSEQVAAFLELHIEQGGVLEKLAKPVGIVQAIVSATRMVIDITGRPDHAGGTPMAERKDALLTAAKMIVEFHRILREEGGRYTVGNIGSITVAPGSVTTVPARATMLAEVRDIVASTKNQMRDRVVSQFRSIGESSHVKVEVTILTDPDPIIIPEWVQNLLIDACHDARAVYHVMPSAGGHDACYLAEIAPTGMIFVPSHEGLSHQPSEHTELSDIAAGCEVLVQGLLRMDRYLNR